MNDLLEKELSDVINSLDNLKYVLNMNASDKIHVEALRKIIPELSEKLKRAYVQDGGENHWNI